MTPRGDVAAALEEAAAAFDGRARLPHDPLGKVRERAPVEWEIAAHIASTLAYGAVPLLRRAIGEVFETLGPDLRVALQGFRAGDFTHANPRFVYRMTRAEDVDALLLGLSRLLGEFGTLGAAFAAGDTHRGDVNGALGNYVALLRGAMETERRGARYLTPDPRTGSAAKRWHLMLRWLVRADDGVDLGLWREVGAERLVLPLDTHVSRLVRALGFTARRTADYRMAREATDALAAIDPSDPMRFDMPLCHLGIARACVHEWSDETCPTCPLRGVCTWTSGQERASRA